ncbi:bifunctional hydroxymethylpyrimidine kinase/phosphomethylpyrimidine kinase [Sphingomonas sp. FW199]|uniref:bifunctional hydroxymethylpyrimidine kinase/phosphomethylpyrimidine kinase n=1 Tax=Sphingomonas sp. FW199 TaxID=3400217 RepID=UPI003CF4B2D4
MSIPRILIIAGSDSGGGAGIQADIKTVTMLGGHAMTAITAITAQNTLGVDAVHAVPADMVLAQIDSVVRDIGVDAVKIGMIGSARTALAVAQRLADLRGIPIVFDPVMVATSGAALADDATIGAFERLMQVASVTTPNLPELKALGGNAAALVAAHGTAVLVKGGHGDGATVTDRLFQPAASGPPEIAFAAPRIDSMATHGTGCTLSSALATELAKEWDLPRAVERARLFVRLAMQNAPGLGGGHGPMGHASVRLDLGASPYAPVMNQITVPVADIATAEHFYRMLGLNQIVSTPGKYARFESDGGTTLSLERPEKMGARAMLYFECADLDMTLSYLRAQGVQVTQEPVDERWGWREARLNDPAGNPVCLYQAGEMRRFPPWRLAATPE